MQMKQLVSTSSLALLGAFLLGCGANAATVREANNSSYNAEFSLVYSTALGVIQDFYPQLEEDPGKGIIKTAWHPIKITQTVGQTPQNPLRNTPSVQTRQKRYFVRFNVAILGPRPYKVKIDGQASSWTAGEVPAPLRGAEIPPWLGGRTETLKVEIHQKLSKHAVKMQTKSIAAAAPSPKPAKNVNSSLPLGAAQVVSRLKTAAGKRRYAEVADYLGETVTWSKEDGPGDKEMALAIWQADPAWLANLEELLASPCDLLTPNTIRCSKGALAHGWTALFSKKSGSWKLTQFYELK